MRTYYRASGGIDGAIQTLLYGAVMATAPIWIPALLIWGAWTYFTQPDEKASNESIRAIAVESQRKTAERAARLAQDPHGVLAPTDPLPPPGFIVDKPVAKPTPKPVVKPAAKPKPKPVPGECDAYRSLEQRGLDSIAGGYPLTGTDRLKTARAKLAELGC